MTRSSRFLLLTATLALLWIAATGCNEKPGPLQLADLTPAESRYVTRLVVLERAKAVALVDRTAGSALLDSLAAAWGDSALERTVEGLSTDPHRSNGVHELLVRILNAERDSLVEAPRTDRLSAPLPDPPPAETR